MRCGRSEPPWSPAVTSPRLGLLKVPGFTPGATHGTTGPSSSTWPHSHNSMAPERCRVGVWGLCSGGKSAPSPLCPCSGPCWCPSGVPPGPSRHPEARAPPQSRAVPGAVAAMGKAGKRGFLRPESRWAAAGEEALAESPLPAPGWARGPAPSSSLGSTRVGRLPHTTLGWDLAAIPFLCTAGTPGPVSPQHSQSDAGKWGPVPVPPSAPHQPGRGGTPGAAMPRPHGTATGGGCWVSGGSPRSMGSGCVAEPPPGPPRPAGPQLGRSRGSLRGLHWH